MIANIIEHTLLKPDIVLADIKELCAEAEQYGFAGVCIPPPFVRNARTFIDDQNIKVVTVVGFPLGYSISKAKIFETAQALDDGADEIDMVINITALKNKQWKYLESEIKYIEEAVHKNGKQLKVIIETGILTDEEIIRCCELFSGAGADYIKTSTGYAQTGATTHAVALMKQHLPDNIKIKASGGIKSYEFARELIGAGADRIGTSSGLEIVKGERKD